MVIKEQQEGPGALGGYSLGILLLALSLAVFGLVVQYSAGISLSATNRTGAFFRQLAYVPIALLAGYALFRLDLDRIRTWRWWILGGACFLMLLARIPNIGVSVNGSWRWIDFGLFRLQASDLGKLALVIVLADFLARMQRHTLPNKFTLAASAICVADAQRRIIMHRARRRARLLRVAKDSHRVELRALDECDEFFMIGLGLAGVSCDEGRADCHPRNSFSQFLHDVLLMFSRHIAPHEREHAIARVLQGHVDVFHEARKARDRIHHCGSEVRGIGVHQSHPAAAGILHDTVELLKHSDKTALVADVHSPTGCVLPDEVQLDGAIGQEHARFAGDRIACFRAHLAANRWNRAE